MMARTKMIKKKRILDTDRIYIKKRSGENESKTIHSLQDMRSTHSKKEEKENILKAVGVKVEYGEPLCEGD